MNFHKNFVSLINTISKVIKDADYVFCTFETIWSNLFLAVFVQYIALSALVSHTELSFKIILFLKYLKIANSSRLVLGGASTYRAGKIVIL